MDQQPQNEPRAVRIDWNDIKARIGELRRYLPQFFKNPVEAIRHVPDWDWATVIILQILSSMASGLFGNIVSRAWLALILSPVMYPVIGLITTFAVAGFFYYAFIFIEKSQIEFRRIYVIVVLSFIPFYAVGVFTGLFRPIIIFGIAAASYLLINGFSGNLMFDRKRLTRLIATVATVAGLFVLYNYIDDRTSAKYQVWDNYTPESLDQIKKELGQ